MTSVRQIAANQRNSRKSRGPKTISGKLRARNNALRHGLSFVTQRDPTIQKQIEQIAMAICGGAAADANLFEQAKVIAETELLRHLVYKEMVRLFGKIRAPFGKSNAESNSVNLQIEQSQPSLIPNEFEAMEEALPDLERLQRDERRAHSRQRRAITLFIALRSQGGDGLGNVEAPGG